MLLMVLEQTKPLPTHYVRQIEPEWLRILSRILDKVG